jgi:hypothetical protein
MRNSVKLLVLVSVAIATLIFSCVKDEPKKTSDNDNPYVKGNDSCSACNELKQVILSDPNIDDKYIDSLKCEFISFRDYCILNIQRNLNEPKPYTIFFPSIREYQVKNSLENNYKNVYADVKPNNDTPFMGPVTFAFDNNEDNSLSKIIPGFIYDDLYFYDSNHFEYNSQGDYIKKPFYRLINNNYPYPNVRIGQLQDTFTFWMREKKVIINGKERYFTVFHKFVLSPDRETMSLTARFIDLDRYSKTGDTTNPDFVSRRYVLKRLK